MNKKTFFAVAVVGLLLNQGLNGFWAETKSFFSAFIRDPKAVGSVIPSSRFLSESATRYIETKDHPIHILEIGAGTGPFSEEIIKKMGPADSLDIIEIDPDLCAVLRQKFGEHENVHVHCLSILDWNPSYFYDYIVSALPHNTFDADFVLAVLDKYKNLINQDGVLSYIELMGFGNLKKFFLTGKKKKDYLKNIGATESFRKQFEFSVDTVLLNCPPAHAYHLRIQK